MRRGDAKSYCNPDYAEGTCKLRTFSFILTALDNSAVHMCLFVASDTIMLLLFNQLEWILMHYRSWGAPLLAFCVSAQESQLVLLVFFFVFCTPHPTPPLPVLPDAWIRHHIAAPSPF